MRVIQVLCIIACLFMATSAEAQRKILRSGEYFGVGDVLYMDVSGKLEDASLIKLEKNGQLQYYNPNPNPKQPPRKFGGPIGKAGPERSDYIVMMRNDGNLAVVGPGNALLWDTGVKGMPVGNYFARLHPSGSTLIFMGNDYATHPGNTVWTSGTAGARKAEDIFPYYRLPLTEAQAASLSAAQIERYNQGIMFQTEVERKKWFDEREAAAAAALAKQRADQAAVEAAAAAEAAKKAALASKTISASCPKQLEGDKVQGRGDMLYEDPTRATMRTRNCLNRPVWITIYDVAKLRHLDFGCVAPQTLRDWKSGNYLLGVYFVRAEVVERTTSGPEQCMGAKLGDTTIQVNIGGNDLGAAANVDVMIDPSRGNFYFTNQVKVGQGIVAGIGSAVGYAAERTKITQAVTYAWKQLEASCGTVAKVMPTPLTPYLLAAEKSGIKPIQDAATCSRYATETFYCEFPKELVNTFESAKGSVALADRILKESVSSECLGFLPAVTVMPQAPMFCAMGKVLIGDAAKVVTCATAAESAGIFKKALLGEGQTYVDFPSERACRSLGSIAFKIAMEAATNGINAQAKAAMAAGKGRTASMVASEFLEMNGRAGKAAAFETLTRDLEALPACKG